MSNHPLFVCVPKVKKFLKKVSEPKLSIPNVNTERFNPILHGGGGGHKVLALISKIRIFETNTATATKFGDFSQNLSGKTTVC